MQFPPGNTPDSPDNNVYVKEYTYLGIVGSITGEGFAVLEQRNKFSVGDVVEVMRKNGENIAASVLEIKDEDGNSMESCPHPKQKIFVKFSCEVEEFDLIRQKSEEA